MRSFPDQQQITSEDTGRFYPAILMIAAFGSLAFGFLMGSTSAIGMLFALPIVLLALYIGLVKPELLAAVLVGVSWGYISEILVKFHDAPSISKPLVVFLIGVLLVRRFTGKRTPLVYHPLQWWIIAYFLVVSAGLWYAGEPDRTWLIVIDFAKELMLFFVIINLITSERILETGIWLMLLIGAAFGLLTFYQEITNNYGNNFGGFARSNVAQIAENVSNRPRAGGPTNEPNAFGQQLLVLVPIGLWAIISTRSLASRSIGIVATLACLAGAGLSFSRGTYLALVVMFVLLVLHLRLNPRFLLVIPVLWIALSFTPGEIGARFNTLDSLLPSSQVDERDASLKRRSVETLMAFYMFLDHPVVGVGADNFRPLYPVYVREYGGNVPDEQRNAHSYYLEIAAEHGLIGLTVIAGVMLLTVRSLLHARQWFLAVGDHRRAELMAALLIAFAGYAVSATFLHGDYSRFLWQQVDIAAACSVIAARAHQRKFGQLPSISTATQLLPAETRLS